MDVPSPEQAHVKKSGGLLIRGGSRDSAMIDGSLDSDTQSNILRKYLLSLFEWRTIRLSDGSGKKTGLTMRVSISQVFAGLLAGCSALAFAGLGSEEVVWRNQPLVYKQLGTPSQFNDNGRSAPLLVLTPSCWAKYESGPAMFQKLYERGWKRGRKDFYHNDSANEWTFDRKRKFNLPTNKWKRDHFDFAYFSGYVDCKSQIKELLKTHEADELRYRLCYSKLWQTIPLCCLFVVSTISIPFLRPGKIDDART